MHTHIELIYFNQYEKKASVSVIVPIYKTPIAYLKQCIESILTQDFIDISIILVDDGSPDNCGSICDTYAQKMIE